MTTVMRWRSRTLFAAACMAGLVFLLFRKSGKDTMTLNLFPMHGAARSSTLPCLDLPGAGDAVVVLRTGSTELQDKLPVHLSTTLQCYPNYLVFSDYEEIYHGETIVDVLSSVSKQILDDHPDFELYRRLKRLGRSALLASELSGAESEAIQWHGKTQNPGWKLDKWKFLPMVNRTFSEFPDKKWYIFVEADSFIFWRSTLQYLALMDHTKPHYSGSQMFIGDVLFAHGGSGFFVSLPAMRMVVDYHASHQEKIEKFTDGHWAGDCVLGKVFKDAGVHFTNSWPIFQGDYPGIVPYAKPDDRPVADVKTRVWCYPTISYHHLSPEIVEDLWYFEQRWFKSNPMAQDSDTVLRHKDVFHSYILPNMSTPRSSWDNESDSDEGILSSMDTCKAKCEEDSQCRQYSFDNERRCRARTDPGLGKATSDIESGWLPDRMVTFDQQMAPCGDEG